MRKYLAAAAIGAMLIGSQAVAADSAVVNADQRLGSQSDTANSWDGGLSPLLWALLIGGGLIGYAVSQSGGGSPISP